MLLLKLNHKYEQLENVMVDDVLKKAVNVAVFS